MNTALQSQAQVPQQGKILINKVVDELPQFGMWVGFLYILYFVSLYVWATSFGNIAHEVVNRYIQDSLATEEATRSFGFFGKDYIIRWSLASMIIFYPLFVLIHFMITRLQLARPEVVNIRVRKILIYTTLIGTSFIASYQLVKIIYSFLNGSISSRTVAHFAVTTLIATVIFGLYLLQVKRDKNP